MASAILSTLAARSATIHFNATMNPNICTPSTCTLDYSIYKYKPSIFGNSIFLALFLISLIMYSIQGIFRFRSNWGFTLMMCIGCVLEVMGYVGRIMSHSNPFAKGPYLLQICALTIAPAWFAAGIYLNLAKIVTIFGERTSRIPAKWYTRIFIPCDSLSLILQALGGAMASIASNNDKDPKLGTNVMLAGLGFQVLTLALFIALAADYAIRVRRQEAALAPEHAKLRGSRYFKGFIVALAVATLCIFTRSVYRVAELSGGWTGTLMTNQLFFIVLEGVMVVIAVLALNVYHPSRALKKHNSESEKEGDDGVAA